MPSKNATTNDKQSFHFAHSIQQVAVIGAGPSGIATARRLIQAGIKVTVFERNSQSGGIWLYQPELPPRPKFPSHTEVSDEGEEEVEEQYPGTDADLLRQHAPPGACYEALMNNIPTPMMEYPGCTYPKDLPWFVSRQEILQYIQKASDTFSVDQFTRYNTRVMKVEKILEDDGGRWRIKSKQLMEEPESGKLNSCFFSEIFDGVVVCTGRYDFPYIPDISGLRECFLACPSVFSHSKEYRSNDSFRGKTVLLLGSGSSATDITTSLSHVCKTLYQSIQSPATANTPASQKAEFLRTLHPPNVHQVPVVTSFSLSLSPPSPSISAHLQNGTTIAAIDAILFCTGYRQCHPFLPPLLRNIHNLHLDIFSTLDPSLAFVGLPGDIATLPFFDVQAQAVAAMFSGVQGLPQRKERWGQGEAMLLGVERERNYVEMVLRWVGAGDTAYGERLEWARKTQVEVWIQAVRKRMGIEGN